MEGTYPLESYPCVSQLFKIHEYFDEYTKFLAETLYQNIDEINYKDNELEKIACFMGVDLEESKRLDELCSLSLLDCKTEEANISSGVGSHKTNSEDALLEKATRTLVTAVELKAAKSRPMRYARKMRELKKTLVPDFMAEPNPSPVMKISNNFVVIARVYRPFNSYSGPQPVPHAQDFMLLGTQSLISFRERITCVNDEVVVGDSINNIENAGAEVPMKRLFTSGMFFFGNTFYCDFRDIMSKDYGSVVDRWAKENPQMKLGPFQHRPMEQSTIADLEIRLGYPYLYMHLGSCEHLITFVDARLMSTHDLQDSVRYPLIEETDSNIMYCCACDTYATSWIVEDDAMPTKPANLCKQCFDVFYTRNGQHVTPPFCCMIPPSGPQEPSN